MDIIIKVGQQTLSHFRGVLCYKAITIDDIPTWLHQLSDKEPLVLIEKLYPFEISRAKDVLSEVSQKVYINSEDCFPELKELDNIVPVSLIDFTELVEKKSGIKQRPPRGMEKPEAQDTEDNDREEQSTGDTGKSVQAPDKGKDKDIQKASEDKPEKEKTEAVSGKSAEQKAPDTDKKDAKPGTDDLADIIEPIHIKKESGKPASDEKAEWMQLLESEVADLQSRLDDITAKYKESLRSNSENRKTIDTLKESLEKDEDELAHFKDAEHDSEAEEIRQLKAELEEKKKQYAELKAEYDELKTKFDNTVIDFNAAKKTLAKLRKELEKSAAENKNAGNKSASDTAEADKLKRRLTALNVRLAEAEEQLSAEKNKAEKSAGTISALNAQLKDITDKLDKKASDYSQLTQQNTRLTAETAGLHKAKELSDAQLKEYKAKAEQLEADIKALQNSTDELKAQLSRLKQDVQDKEQQITVLESDKTALQGKADELEKAVAEHNKSVQQTVDETRKQLEQKEAEYTQKLRTKDAELESINAALEQGKQEITQKTAEIQQLQNDISNKTAEIQQLNNTAVQYQADIQQLQDTISQNNLNINKLNSDVQSGNAEIQNLRNKVQSAEQEKQNYIQQLNTAQNTITEIQNSTDKYLAERTAELQNTISNQQRQLTDTSNELTVYKEKYQEALNESAEYRKTISSMQDQVLSAKETSSSSRSVLEIQSKKLEITQKELDDTKKTAVEWEKKAKKLEGNVQQLKQDLKQEKIKFDENKTLLAALQKTILQDTVTVPANPAGSIKISYMGKARIIPVYGSGSYGVSLVAASIAHKLEKPRVLVMDLDTRAPKLDKYMQKQPIIQTLRDIPNAMERSSFTAFLKFGTDYLASHPASIQKVDMHNKGQLDYFSGMYTNISLPQLLSADYSALLNFYGGKYDYIVLDLGIIGNIVTDALIYGLSPVAYKEVMVSLNCGIDTRSAYVQLTNKGMDTRNLIWVLNLAKTTKLESTTKSIVQGAAGYVIIAMNVDMYNTNKTIDKMPISSSMFHELMRMLD